MLGICNVMVGAFMGLAGWYAVTAAKVEFGVLFPLFAMGTAAFMPTISLSNTVIFKSLRDAGINADAAFPRIRLFGTLGFICGMLTVNMRLTIFYLPIWWWGRLAPLVEAVFRAIRCQAGADEALCRACRLGSGSHRPSSVHPFWVRREGTAVR